MRLARLWIGAFRNLQDVSLDLESRDTFYEGVSIGFLVGVNGTGKSNVLDAIGTVFSHLNVGLTPPFAFDLEYEIRGQRVRVCVPDRVDLDGALPVADLDLVLMVRRLEPEREWQIDDVRSDSGALRDVLPSRVVGQSSGHISTLGVALEQSVEHQLASREDPSEPLLAAEDEEIRRTTRRSLLDDRTIAFLNAADAVLAALAVLAHVGGPHFDRPALVGILARVGLAGPNALVAFAGQLAEDWSSLVHGASRDRLERFVNMSARSVPLTDLQGDPEATAFRLAFDYGSCAEAFRRTHPSPQLLFDDLVAWRRAGAFTDPVLILRKSGVTGVITHRHLSDGEYAYLTRYSLVTLAIDVADSLLLFDEIESHFNGAWCMDLVSNLVAIGGRDASADIVLATHSDIVLTDADPAAVVHFTHDDGAVVADAAPIPTLAASRQEIASRFFEVSGGVGRFGLEMVRRTLVRDRDAIDALLPKVGPGLSRFRLERRRDELEEGA